MSEDSLTFILRDDLSHAEYKLFENLIIERITGQTIQPLIFLLSDVNHRETYGGKLLQLVFRNRKTLDNIVMLQGLKPSHINMLTSEPNLEPPDFDDFGGGAGVREPRPRPPGLLEGAAKPDE